ncbi:MAG: aminoglycoside resistance protein [Herbinix sp.]|nr:aminoglycoside resistance protein [Herbinix sp.]
MSFLFSFEETDKIINHFGQQYYEKIKKDLEVYSHKWKLEIVQLVDYFSVNCIFICKSDDFGNAILKIGNQNNEILTEYNTLKEYDGKHFCKVYASDLENGIILEELIKPGRQLRNEKSLEKRLNIFSSLYNGLHIKPKNPNIYPTYSDWVSRITKYMSNRPDYKELYYYMKKAEDICHGINSLHAKKMLLHGDLHHDNILLQGDTQYKIIDPKGVVGDPIFDVPRFILNENDDEISTEENYKKICCIIQYLEKSLGIPSAIIKQCYFIEMTMANCWDVESNGTPNMNNVYMAHDIMTSK